MIAPNTFSIFSLHIEVSHYSTTKPSITLGGLDRYFQEIPMDWFISTAPVRRKLLISYAAMIMLAALIAVVGAVGSGGRWYVVLTGIGGIVVSAVMASIFRRAIADPYVATVVRMERLAAGDLSSPIAFTDYVDCVGRMTKAMFTFKDTAAAQRAASAE
eukprot:gene6644-8977_t